MSLNYSDEELRQTLALVSGTRADASPYLQEALNRGMQFPPGQYVIAGPPLQINDYHDVTFSHVR